LGKTRKKKVVLFPKLIIFGLKGGIAAWGREEARRERTDSMFTTRLNYTWGGATPVYP